MRRDARHCGRHRVSRSARLDLELEIAKRSITLLASNSLELTKSREEGGVASMQDVYQARILVSTAEASIADIHRRVEQQENLLSILLGRNPATSQRGVAADHEAPFAPKSRPACPPRCWNGVPDIRTRRASTSSPPMLTSARPRPPSFRS